MTEFYDNIEPEIRDLVKYLRDNGINTTCSCGHEMTIQAEMLISGWLQILHNSLFNYFCEHQIQPNYTIEARIEVCGGKVWRHWADIKIS